MTRRLSFISVALVSAMLCAVEATGQDASVTVREKSGAYFVAARFTVPEPSGVVREVLTDYANIPRFMPHVRTSRVLDRQNAQVRLEQEAVSSYLMFSKRIHLVLDVEETADTIRFRDRCNKSFVQYEGAWTIAVRSGHTELTYELTADPAFSVPAFVLRKLLDRDANLMIEGLRAEISGRAIRQEGAHTF